MSEEKFLKEIKHLDSRINSKIRQLDLLRHQIGSLKSFDYSKDRVQESNIQGSQIENLIVKICDLEGEITKDIDKLVDKKRQAIETVNKMEGLGGSIMEMRYLEGRSWENITVILHISPQYAFELHNRELKKLKRTE